DFKEYAPDAKYDPKGDRSDEGEDERVLPRIDSVVAKSFKGSFTYEKELREVNGIIPFERVIAYGFRGETRPPGAVKAAGGFLPNYTRPDHIRKHQEKLKEARAKPDLEGKIKALFQWGGGETGALNLQHFIANQTYRGFISTTKSVAVAKYFATTRFDANGMG